MGHPFMMKTCIDQRKCRKAGVLFLLMILEIMLLTVWPAYAEAADTVTDIYDMHPCTGKRQSY